MAALITTISLTGCKDDAVTPATPEVAVTLKDGSIVMTETIKAGKTIFKVTNAGTKAHQFEVERVRGGVEVETALLQPGQTASLEVDLTAEEYEFYCPVQPRTEHEDIGEIHEFDVMP
jgi:uncharacterized cupredoxin-like copper-binding protein